MNTDRNNRYQKKVHSKTPKKGDFKIKKRVNKIKYFTHSFKVDLTGVEPVSKRGINSLSTCLSSLKFSRHGKTEATNTVLILFILT